MPANKPAAELAAAAYRPYPGESPAYTEARRALLAEEVELRRHIERVARRRRELPAAPAAVDCVLRDENDRTIGLADLFGQHDTLVTYAWMYGPKRPRPCPMCTSFLGSLDIPAADLTQRVALAVLGRSPVSRQLAFARERGWRNLKFYQLTDDDWARQHGALDTDGCEYPALDVWIRREGGVRHFWNSQLGGTQDPGEDPRGAPDPTPLWNLLDLTPAGRGTDWYPKLAY